MTDANLVQNSKAPRCSKSVHGRNRWDMFHPHRCTRVGVVERSGQWFCKQHDPQVQEEKDAAQAARRKQQNQRDDQIIFEATDILKQLGVPGTASTGRNPVGHFFVNKAIVISFDSARELIRRLRLLERNE